MKVPTGMHFTKKEQVDMDRNELNGSTPGAHGMNDMPLGFGFALAMNESAMSAYASLSEAEKERLIGRCRNATSKKEMQHIVDSLATEAGTTGSIEEEKDKWN